MAGINRVAPYHPPEVRRGPFIFPKLGSTNSNSPTRNPASLVGNFGRVRDPKLGSGPANPYDLKRTATGTVGVIKAKVQAVVPKTLPASLPGKTPVISRVQQLFNGRLGR